MFLQPYLGALVGAAITGTVGWTVARRSRKAEDRKQIREWATNLLEAVDKVGSWDRNLALKDDGVKPDEFSRAIDELMAPVLHAFTQGELFVPKDISDKAQKLTTNVSALFMPILTAAERASKRDDVLDARIEFVNSIRKLHRLPPRERLRPRDGLNSNDPEEFRKALREDPEFGPRLKAAAEKMANEKNAPSRERPSTD
ncbi:hypothetical protein [Dietzia cinnamea]|uniref:hypothetical protein n=1 Tax=Dietzia cinnamea TaxID=321318 RepID=UPI00223AEC0D|nr:hypothetical protein [Dietzia cinnamea]MCT2077507.1 hypothetical protein [Dietzia cinnamea]MCT2219808.1 hypothetical protein [Dietzia cinnamea]